MKLVNNLLVIDEILSESQSGRKVPFPNVIIYPAIASIDPCVRPTDATGLSAVGAVTSGMRRSASARSLKAALSPVNQTGWYHISCGCVPGFSANLEIGGKLEKEFYFSQSGKNQGI